MGGFSAGPALDYSSFIEAGKQMEISPNVSGKVQAVNAEIGQKVAKGEVLFVVDSTDAEMQIKQAEAGIVPARIAHDDANAAYDRLQILYEEGAIAKAELDNAKTRLETTRAQLESAEIGLEAAQRKFADYTVTAPISGEVASKHINIGGMISPQTAAITLIDTQEVLLHVNVTETNISRVKIGTKAQIKVPAINAAAEGAVVNIAPASDPQTGMFPVEIRVSNPGGKFKPGMITDVKLLLKSNS